MIQIRNKVGSVPPDIVINEGALRVEEYKVEFDKGEVNFEFDSTIYGHTSVKNKLRELQSHKCCFCESKFTHVSYGDVEHFRPKAGWVQDNEPINKPGYYWLAYDWDNLLLSCQLCNQRHKKNYFPVADATKRAVSHNNDIFLEQPLFLHPVHDDPTLHIEYDENIPIAKSDRGKITIEKLGLKRKELNEQRKEKFNIIKDVYDLFMGVPETDAQRKAIAKTIITKYYNASQKDETEYASMLRCFFKKYPINF